MSLLSAGQSVHEARQHIQQRLAGAGIDSAQSEAQQLLEAVLGLDRVGLLMRSAPLTAAEASTLEDLVARRAARLPLQHLLGQVEWGGLVLEVSPAALIPRPETEVLLELAKAEATRLLAAGLPITIADIGTGTGALALGLKQWLNTQRGTAQVWASDISPQALALAGRNTQRLGLELGLDIELIQSDLLGQLPRGIDLLVSNPPYLPSSDEPEAQPEVRHDPALALYSGADGLDLSRRLMQEAGQHLSRRGVVLLELDPRNVHTLAGELRGEWQVEIHGDLTGRQRFLRAWRSNNG